MSSARSRPEDLSIHLSRISPIGYQSYFSIHLLSSMGIIIAAYRDFSSRVKILATSGLSKPERIREAAKILWYERPSIAASFARILSASSKSLINIRGLSYQSIFAGEVRIGERIVEGGQLKWSVFHDFPAGKMYTTHIMFLIFSIKKNFFFTVFF